MPNSKLATLEQYYTMMDRRPDKFTPEQVQFQKDADGYPCCACVHWFWNPLTGSMVCEVMRPDSEDEIVPADWTCQFFTRDYETFPKMEEPK